MNIGSILLSVIISFAVAALIYKAFESSSFIAGFIVCYIALIINAFITNKTFFSPSIFVIAIIPTLLETCIYKAIYNRSNSLTDFLKKYILVVVLISVIVGGIAFSITKISEHQEDKKLEESRQAVEDAKNIVDCGEYTLGQTINFGNKYQFRITKIENPGIMQSNLSLNLNSSDLSTFYPTAGKTFVWIEYYVDKGITGSSFHPSFTFEDVNGEKYRKLYKVHDSRSDKQADPDVFFSNKDKNVNHLVYEVPEDLVRSNNCYLLISEKYEKGKSTLINRFHYVFH